MNNREKAKQVLEQTFGVELSNNFLNNLKGCKYIKNTECNTYQDCEHCDKFHFWYNKFTGTDTPMNLDKEQVLKQYKTKLRDVIEAESRRTNEEDEYIYSYSEEKLFVKLIELIWNTNLE